MVILGTTASAIATVVWIVIHYDWGYQAYRILQHAFQWCDSWSWWPEILLIGVIDFEIISVQFYGRVVFRWGQAWVKIGKPLRKNKKLHLELYTADISILGCLSLIAFGITGISWELLHHFFLLEVTWPQAQPLILAAGTGLALFFWLLWYLGPTMWVKAFEFTIAFGHKQQEPLVVPSFLAHALLRMPPRKVKED